MPFELKLPESQRRAGWKVKILEKERLEPPHATIIFGWKKWRLGLRDERFLDVGHSWKQIPDEVKSTVMDNLEDLRHAWDAKYPGNPVAGEDDGEQD